jgi:hypothetical protein
MTIGGHEALLWKPAHDEAVDCFLCEHRCHIAPGQRGVCRVRENQGGQLMTLVYGRLIARHVDPIEKKPLCHFLPGSESYSVAAVGCNFQCGFCQNWQISQWPRSTPGEMPGEPMSPAEIVADARRHACASISYTYTEPTIFYEYARDTALLARAAGLKNVFVTNGFMTPEALDDIVTWLDAANVDLKAWRDEFYRKTCKGRIEPVKESIRRMHAAGVHGRERFAGRAERHRGVPGVAFAGPRVAREPVSPGFRDERAAAHAAGDDSAGGRDRARRGPPVRLRRQRGGDVRHRVPVVRGEGDRAAGPLDGFDESTWRSLREVRGGDSDHPGVNETSIGRRLQRWRRNGRRSVSSGLDSWAPPWPRTL